jgi:hypothetical protein
LIADCIPDISSGVPVYFLAVFMIDFTGDAMTSAHNLAVFNTFGATYPAPFARAFPVANVPVFIAFPIGLANGTGASCHTFKSPAIFSARIGFSCSNIFQALE